MVGPVTQEREEREREGKVDGAKDLARASGHEWCRGRGRGGGDGGQSRCGPREEKGRQKRVKESGDWRSQGAWTKENSYQLVGREEMWLIDCQESDGERKMVVSDWKFAGKTFVHCTRLLG